MDDNSGMYMTTKLSIYCTKYTCQDCKLFDRCKRYMELKLTRDELIKSGKNEIIPNIFGHLDEGEHVQNV